MDPDSGGYCTSSAFLKTSVLTITLTSFYFYKTEKTLPFLRPAFIQAEVVITKKEIPLNKKTKTIYLTFDDGPNKGTRNVSRILQAENVPATLFLIGQHVYGSKLQSQLYDSLKNNSLFEIANHSFTHAGGKGYNRFYEMPDSTLKDFNRCADSLQLFSRIIRTPGRNIWRMKNINRTDNKLSVAAADTLMKAGYIIAGWDLEWHYNAGMHVVQTPCELLSQVDSMFAHNRTKTPGHLILLAHDQVYSTSCDSTALQEFIYQLKARDEFNFETVSKYPGVSN